MEYTGRVNRQSTTRRSKGGSIGNINATFEVDDRTVFSSTKTFNEYRAGVRNKPLTSTQSVGKGEDFMYVVDAAGQVIRGDLALDLAQRIQRAQILGIKVSKKFLQAVKITTNKCGVYSMNRLRP